MNSVSHFADSYNSGAPCFLYNILAHHPDRIVIAAEVDGSQTQDAAKALTELGADVPVVRLLCIYGDR
jgi:pentose-5-phosphate-3-epimerase